MNARHVIITVLGLTLAACATLLGPPMPVADFVASPTAGSTPLTVYFQNLSLGPVERVRWNFDDPLALAADTWPAANNSAVHTFRFPGSYHVTLVVEGPMGGAMHTEVITVEDR